MSNTRAIAAVTATLTALLQRVTSTIGNDPPDSDLLNVRITAKPLDKARDASDTPDQLNVFLYQVAPNVAKRNYDYSYSTNNPSAIPLALDLFYLLTAYGEGSDDSRAHRLLGRAMTILHDQAVLRSADIKAALAGNDLYRQVERVRITPHAISSEEMSKLWPIFQIGYRLSVGYQLSVILIDAPTPAPSPLPVLVRGRIDDPSHPDYVNPDLIPITPTLSTLTIPNQQPSARLGDTLVLNGYNLTGSPLLVDFAHLTQQASESVSPLAGGNATTLSVVVQSSPPDDTAWPAGAWSVSVSATNPGDPDRESNPLYFTLAPRITGFSPGARDANGDLTLTLTVTPEIWDDQDVWLLLDTIEVPRADSGRTHAPQFRLSNPPAGPHRCRLRVDGVQSFLIASFTVTPPQFDPTQTVTL